MTMDLTFRRVSITIVTIVLFLSACDKNPLAPGKAQGNRGSGMLAIDFGLTAIREYAKTNNGVLPKAGADLTMLGGDMLTESMAAALLYGGSDSLTLNSDPRLILLKFKYPSPLKNGEDVYYCGLLSGKLVVLRAIDAQLGMVCPEGKELNAYAPTNAP